MDLNYRVNYFPLIPFYKAEEILINPIVIAEMLIGFKLGTKEEQNKNEFYEFLNSPRLSVFEIGEMTAEHYSNIFLQLKNLSKIF